MNYSSYIYNNLASGCSYAWNTSVAGLQIVHNELTHNFLNVLGTSARASTVTYFIFSAYFFKRGYQAETLSGKFSGYGGGIAFAALGIYNIVNLYNELLPKHMQNCDRLKGDLNERFNVICEHMDSIGFRAFYKAVDDYNAQCSGFAERINDLMGIMKCSGWSKQGEKTVQLVAKLIKKG